MAEERITGARPGRPWRRLPPGAALRARLLILLAVIGPGLITGAADDDATGITTYSIAGARYGYRLLWVLTLSTIFLATTQEMGARLGVVTGKGLGGLLREKFGVRWATLVVGAMLVANLGVVAGDFAGIAAGAEMFRVPRLISVPLVASLVLLLVLRGNYKRIEKAFLAISMVLLAYAVSAVLAAPAWGSALRSLVLPTVSFDPELLLAAVAILGTTITPWGQFFIQDYALDKGLREEDLPYVRVDIWAGTAFTNLIAFFIWVAAAATLYPRGIEIRNAGEAALALRPLAGDLASFLFGLGILNGGLIGVAVIPLSTAYAVCEALGFEFGLDRPVREAPVFYYLYVAVVSLGAALVLLPGATLVSFMYLCNVVNAVVLPFLLIFVYKLTKDDELLGKHTNGKLARALATATVLATSVFSLAMVASYLARGA